MTRWALAALALTATHTLWVSPCEAKPQWNIGVETGACGSGSSFGFAEVGWCNALHADVMLLRKRGGDFGLGPALRLGSVSFADIRLGAGLSVLVPVFESLPLVLEAGPQLRNLDQPGIYGTAFFGLRSFNHYGHYEIAAGLALTAERSFTTGTPSTLWLTARIDGAWLTLPFIFVYNAAR